MYDNPEIVPEIITENLGNGQYRLSIDTSFYQPNNWIVIANEYTYRAKDRHPVTGEELDLIN